MTVTLQRKASFPDKIFLLLQSVNVSAEAAGHDHGMERRFQQHRGHRGRPEDIRGRQHRIVVED